MASIIHEEVLSDRAKIVQDETGRYHYYRDGIELDKGIMLNKKRVEEKWGVYTKWMNYFTAYPDKFVELITPAESNFKLFFYQKIFLRACLRYRYHYCTAPRAFSKTFISILGMLLKCIFQPGSKCFICAPKKEQSAKIAKEKFDEIFDLLPLLKKELVGERYNAGSDYVKLTFRNGSVFDVVAALDSQRGGRRHFGLVDEIRDHDGDLLNEVVIPLMNVNRRTKSGIVNTKEPHQAQFYMTSAGQKNSYAYQKLIEILVLEIITPRSAFVWGCDYRVPQHFGLLDKTFLKEIKMSSTYKDDTFAREYMGIWTGGGSDSWFDYDRMIKYRKLINPESHQNIRDNKDGFYLLSVDVGRLGCQTVVTVFKVLPHENEFSIKVVNIYVIGRTPETKSFPAQSLELKRIIDAFDPKEVVVDANGMGIGFMDFLAQETPDPANGKTYPGYCSINLDSHSKKMYPGCVPLIYGLKASASLQPQIDSNCYAKVFSGRIQFLAREQEIKTRLMESKVGQKMKIEKRVARLIPHEMTSRLFEEMANLRLKGVGSEVKLEQINTNMTKDKFSSFEYGLWRIKEIEEEFYKKARKRKGTRKLFFYN
jgi:hypothetical protein